MKIYFILMMLFTIGFVGVRMVMRTEVRRHFGLGLYAAFALILLSGFLLKGGGAFVAIAGIVLLMSARTGVEAICRLAALVPLLPNVIYHVQAAGLYFLDLTTVNCLTLGALLACLIYPRLPARRGVSKEDLIVLLLMIIFSVLKTRNYSPTVLPRETLSVLIYIGFPYFVFSRFVRDRAQFAQVVAVLGGAAMILAVVAMYEAQFHWSVFERVWVNQSTVEFLSRNLRVRAGLLRTPTAFQESTSFAVFQLVGLFAIIASRRAFRNRLFWFGSIALTVIGLLTAQSRGADLALLAGIFALLVMRRRFGAALAMAVSAAALVASLIAIAPSVPKVAALLGMDSGFGSDADYRQLLLRRGLQEGLKHPLLGDDLERVTARLADITQGEGIVDLVNTYLVIFLSSGAIGLGLFAVLLALIGRDLWRLGPMRRGDPADITLHSFVASALTGVLVALAFTSFWERNPYWLMILFAGSRALTLRRTTRVAAPLQPASPLPGSKLVHQTPELGSRGA